LVAIKAAQQYCRSGLKNVARRISQ